MRVFLIIYEAVKNTLLSSVEILNTSSGWLMISFIFAGVLHNIISPAKLQMHLGNKKISSLLKSTISGMFLPICSCGVIPIGISMYMSGSYLGPVLSFMTSTPIINPIAVILSFGLLGPQVTLIYFISGFVVPMIAGIIGNTFGGSELHIQNHLQEIEIVDSEYKDSNNEIYDEEIELIELEEQDATLIQKIIDGLKWSFGELALTVSKYVIVGMLMAGFITSVFPKEIINKYLGNPGMLSLASISVLACIMYVCAVGHIPFIAALVVSGASPGVAITFLIAGAGTNLPELISLYKIIGKRTASIYAITMIISSLVIGYITNLLLNTNEVYLNFQMSKSSIQIANMFTFSIPHLVKYICTVLIIIFAFLAVLPKLKKKYIIIIFTIIGIILISNFISEIRSEKSKQDTTYSTEADENLINYFKSNCKYKEIIIYAQEDVNEDNKGDLVLIYKGIDDKNKMIVVLTNKSNDKLFLTKSVDAPVENQEIKFKDIDSKQPMEIVVSGSKKGNIGYGIYRIENNELINIFGENMKDCCE
jgi:uncharacterized membrane protein YraQ (UPF0718 family)